MKFINREKELGYLDSFWKKEGAQFIAIYGKRRVGKTTLIKHFLKDKPHVYFLAQKISEQENLRTLGELTGALFGEDVLVEKGFSNWPSFFRYFQKRTDKRLVVVIDEFPYLTESNKGISSIFQAGWDEYLAASPICLILCGSSITMMESEVLGEKAPLYGRRTGQILVKPFDFFEAAKFFPGAPFEKQLQLFSLVGGNPGYLKNLSPEETVMGNIRKHFLSPEAVLYSEGEFLLHQELREPRNYFSILRAIAFGKTRISEIANETGFDKSVLHKYIFALEDLGIVRKDVPVTEKNPMKSRKGLYKIDDQYFRFWFRYVLPNKSRIEEGALDPVIKAVNEGFNLLVSMDYEKVARAVVRKNEELFFPIDKIGSWWDKNEEIDIAALNEKEGKLLLGEVKWSNKQVGTDIYEDLKRKSALAEKTTGAMRKSFCLFSKSGFTRAMPQTAKKEKVRLFHGIERVE